MNLSRTRSAAFWDLAPRTDSFRADVVRGLGLPNKSLPPKYFYDQEGARFFEEICELEEYYLTRTELGIMERHAAEMAEVLGPDCLLIEFGSGSGLKTQLLLEQPHSPAMYMPIDLAREQLRQSADAIALRHPRLAVVAVCADFTLPLPIPRNHDFPRRRVVYFPGSTIGNFPPEEAVPLLRQTAQFCGRGGGMLLGADLQKDPAILHAAYNDAKGITAAFNLNLMTRINRELQADFAVDQFWHHAPYNPRDGRIEMYLIARAGQQVRVGEERIAFAEGEPICTEYSYKYTLTGLRELAAAAGWEVRRVWTDERRYFAVLFLAVPTD